MQTEHLKVTGMTCGDCTSKVSSALKAISGVSEAEVSLSAEEAVVQYDERLTSPDQLKLTVKNAGFGLAGETTALRGEAKKGCCG
jgi:copper chaperone